MLDFAPKNIKLDIFREFQKENQLLDNDQNYTITYSTFVVRFLLLEIQKKIKSCGSAKYLWPKQQKIQFRSYSKKDGSTFHYQTLLKTRLIIWTTRAGLSTIQSGSKLTTKYGCDTCRTQATFICTFYRNQFQSNGDFRNIWCIWYLSEPSVNKTCFARIFRLFQLPIPNHCDISFKTSSHQKGKKNDRSLGISGLRF